MTRKINTNSVAERFLSRLELPKGEVLLLHVKLKGLLTDNESSNQLLTQDYSEHAKLIIEAIRVLYEPKAILVPAFTYSFTKSGIYDRTATPSEVGRFGEEVRAIFPHTSRTMNPVFSVIDCDDWLSRYELNEATAFGDGSLWQQLSEHGHVCVNLNLPQLISTHLHYVEAQAKVPYRYIKEFVGRVSEDGRSWNDINYEYVVRNLDEDTKWRREKIATDMVRAGVLHESGNIELPLRWFHSKLADHFLGHRLREDPRYFVTD